MVRVSSNTRSSININSQGSSSVSVASNTNSDINTNQDGNSQRARSWAVGQGLIDGEDYSAKHYAQNAKESADIASSGVEAIEQARDNALATIDDEKTEAIADMETAKEEKIGEIEETAADFEDDLEALATRAESARDAAENYAQQAEDAKDDIEAELDNYVPNTRKVNNKPLSTDITLTSADIGALADTTKYGYSIALSLNTTDYKLTLTLKDQDGTTLSTKTVDFPIESVVVNGSYDSTNQKIVLTLQNGNTIDIPVGDLISGLQSEITSTNKLDADLVDDTNSSHKFATAAQLNQIATNTRSISNLASVATSGDYTDLTNKPTIPDAQVQADWDVTDTTSKAYIKNKPYIPSGVVVDQTYDGTSTNAQSGVAIAGAKFLQNTATATNSLTILGTTNNQNNSILIGYSTTTSSTNSTVIGNTATSGGSYATALGYYARANGQYTTAIGNSSYASYQDVTAVGHNSQATAAGTLAVGSIAKATAQRATSIGYNSQATQYQATALGYEAKATANSALQIGTGTNSTANTLQVSSYTLLNTSTGLIPDARISSNIQRTLVSGTDIKTINNESLLGSGNIDTVFVAEYGVTTYAGVLSAYNAGKTIICRNGVKLGLLSNYNDTAPFINFRFSYTSGDYQAEWYISNDDTWATLVTNLQKKLVSGTNIKTINSTSLLGSGNLSLANTDLSNVSSIDSSSVVATALDEKVNTSDIWYDSPTSTLYIGVAQT